MSDYLTALKDVLVVLSPIIVAYISYRSNKKTKEDIRLEIEKSLKEKDELDFLLCDIFEQRGYVVDNRPKTGNRQFGVDIQL